MLKIITCCLFAGTLFANGVNSGQIALTFDDAPTADSVLMSGAQRAQKIIAALSQNAVPDALFFVKTDAITAQNQAQLEAYAQAGFHLGNHSYSHNSANKLKPNDFLLDVYQSHLILKPLRNKLPYFRFPYLHYGASQDDIDTIQAGLEELGYHNGYVTVDNFDWSINALMLEAISAKNSVNFDKLSQLYVDTLWDGIEFYDKIAQDTLGKSPKHVLLLHENDAAALFLPALINRIRERGWTIITPQEAYAEPSLQQLPKGLFNKQGRVAAIANSRGTAEAALRHPSENVEYLTRQFQERQIVTPQANGL